MFGKPQDVENGIKPKEGVMSDFDFTNGKKKSRDLSLSVMNFEVPAKPITPPMAKSWDERFIEGCTRGWDDSKVPDPAYLAGASFIYRHMRRF